MWTPSSLLFLLLFVPVFQVLPAAALSWSTPSQVPTTTERDEVPSATVDTQGTLWVFWESIKVTSTRLLVDVYYKIHTIQYGWSQDQKLTSDLGYDITPSAAGLLDGSVFVVWASNREGNYNLYGLTLTNGVPGSLGQLTSSLQDDWGPAVVQGLNGTVYLFWHRAVGNSFDLYYKVHDGVSWSGENALTTNTAIDWFPSGLRAKDGKIWVAWSSRRTGDYEIFAKVYDGSKWSSDRQISFDATDDDVSPALVQDRNGTLWLFWSRALNAPAPKGVQTDIYRKTSQDNGVTWSTTDSPVTSTADFDENDVSAVQASDKRIWLIYSSDLSAGTTYHLFSLKSDPIPTRDVAVKEVRALPEKVRYNSSTLINVTLANLGDSLESVEVRVYLGSTLIASGTTTLAVSETKTVSLKSIRLSLGPGRYLLEAVVTPVAGESSANQADNFWKGARLHLLPPGDLDQDGDVDINDAASLAIAFDSRPGSSAWNPLADLNENGVVDILDASLLAFWFDTKT